MLKPVTFTGNGVLLLKTGNYYRLLDVSLGDSVVLPVIITD